MAITTDIVETYRRPRAVLRRHLTDGGQEGRALAVLMGACLLMFLAQWPGAARQAHLDPSIPLDARMGGALIATLFFVPLLAYAVAGVSHLVARAMGGQGTYLGARMALFWSLLAVGPLMLLQGLLRGLVGPGPALTVVGLGVLAAFLALWINALIEAERG
jgi:Na+-transporting methylmalonyl-CoA/oxaloacetate decarboxylase gamma subunit